MRYLFLAVCTSCVLAWYSSALGQGGFVPYGQSGLGLEVGVSSGEQGAGYTVRGGASIQGMIDLGLKVEGVSMKIGGGSRATGIGGDLTIHLLKDGGHNPLGLALEGFYEGLSFSQSISGYSNVASSGDAYGLGLMIYKTMRMTPNSNLVPIMEVGNSWTSTTTTQGFGQTRDNTKSSFLFDFDFAFAFLRKQKSVITITPGLSASEHQTSVHIIFGYIGLSGKQGDH